MPGRIDGMPAPEGPQSTRQQPARRTKNTRDNETTSETDADRVELSETAQETQAQTDRLRETARALPDVRAEKVAQARARIASGAYSSADVRRQIADRILGQLGI